MLNSESCGSYEADPSGEEVVHHALFDLAGFGEFGFEGGDFGVHVGEDHGYGRLLGLVGWERDSK